MVNPVVFATHLARAVNLFRDPAKKEDQKREFRALVGMIKDADVRVRIHNQHLEINGEAVTAPEFQPLVQRMLLHGVNEVTVPRDAPVAHLFELLRALADQPGGTSDLASRLHASGAYRVSVVLQALDLPDEPARARDIGTSGVLRGEPVKDLRSERVAGAEGVEQVEQNLAEPSLGLPGTPAESAAATVELAPELPSRHVTAEPPPSPFPLPPPPPPPPPSPPTAAPAAAPAAPGAPAFIPAPPSPPPPPPPMVPRASIPPALRATPVVQEEEEPLGGEQPEISREAASSMFALREALSKDASDLLSQLEADPQAGNVGETLAVLNRQVEAAMRQGKIEPAMQIVYNVVRVEQQVEDAALRRQYGIALRRMITRPMLDALSKLVQVPHLEDAASIVLQRAGPDGVEVLLDLLATSNTVTERRGVFNALVGMKEGQDQLIHMLSHPQWFVVRNVADIVGELGLEAAIPALTKQLDHTDERVRKQVALALAKIGTRGAAEPLRRVLRDKSADVRRQAALGVGGRKASALAMPLVVALEEEKDPEVVRELIFALGRIGSPDAVQALIKIAQPSGKFFSRKPAALRVTAVEALRVAGTPAAAGTLQGLVSDSDKQVRVAAQQALAELDAKK
ncbi:MAG TPA: HEAT repeat domain-containing protein [Gemmatimonadales bacterium]|jgi:HEAT repeat protein